VATIESGIHIAENRPAASVSSRIAVTSTSLSRIASRDQKDDSSCSQKTHKDEGSIRHKTIRFSLYGIYLHPLHCIILHYYEPRLKLNTNHAPQELHCLQSRSIAGSPAPVLRCMPVRFVLFRGLSKERLEEAPQANLQASQRGAWRHASAKC
jgi:hypothetical protein